MASPRPSSPDFTKKESELIPRLYFLLLFLAELLCTKYTSHQKRKCKKRILINAVDKGLKTVLSYCSSQEVNCVSR